MTKENNQTTPRIETKKHLARLERENRQKRIITLTVIAILVAVAGLITYGILDKSVFQPMKPVAKVGETKISVEKFQKRVEYERLSNVETFINYASSEYAMFFQSSLVELQDQLDNYIQYGSDTLDRMINEAVAAEKAKELGITVSEEDIDKELERGFGFFPNGTPTPEPTVEIRSTSTMSLTQLAIVTITPTPTEFPTETPLPTETLTPGTPTPKFTIEGTVTEPPATATATAIPATSTPTLEPTPEATAAPTEIPPTETPYTQEGFEALQKTMIASINTQFPYSEADFRDYVRDLLINQKVYDYVTKDASRDQEMVWARHILVGTEDEAKAVLERLAAGEEWSALAAELSTDTSNNTSGGDLGWFASGTMVAPFEQAAFALEIGEISEPVATDFGYHIIQALGHEVRQLSDDEFETFKTNAFSKFLEEAKATMDVKKYDVWASVVPSIPAIPAEYRIDTTGQQ